MHEITYVFKKGRKKNYLNKTIEAKEFYYGLPLFEKSRDIQIIEFEIIEETDKRVIKKIERAMSKFLSLPFYFSQILTSENFKILKNSKNIILTNESVACSLLPYLIYLRIFKKRNILIFVMGLYSKKLNYKKLKSLHYLVIKLIVYSANKVFFLGKGELNMAKSNNKNEDKFVYFPFSIDTGFWHTDNLDLENNKNEIIFVGNDSNRNVEILKELPKFLPNLKFKYITNLRELLELEIENVEIIKGDWGKKYLSDTELLEYYKSSKICIIPLIEGNQPSGQSVALQAMSLGIPVIISDTNGFWDKDEFFDNFNISFANQNNIQGWVNKVNDLINNKNLLMTISVNAQKTVIEKFNLKAFYNKLNGFLE